MTSDTHAEHRDRKRRKRMQVHSKASIYLMQQAIARAAQRAASAGRAGETLPSTKSTRRRRR